jgi:hypothetical protein
MRIKIQKQIDVETREIWVFNVFESFNIVFVGWCKEVKPKGKRKWVVENFWDVYSSGKHKEPVLPEIIRSEALSEVMKYLKVRTWNEWKKDE